MKNYTPESFVNNLETNIWNTVNQVKEDVVVALEIFNTMFMQSINDICPEKEIKIKSRTEPWIDAELLEAIRERDRAIYNADRIIHNPDLRFVFNKL